MPNKKYTVKHKPKENQISNPMKPPKFRENLLSQGEKIQIRKNLTITLQEKNKNQINVKEKAEMFEQKGNLQDDKKDKPSGKNPPPEDMDKGDVFCNSEEDDKDDEAQNETTTLETDCNEATPESKESETPTPEEIPETKETKNSTPEAEKEKPKDTKEEDKKHEEDKLTCCSVT